MIVLSQNITKVVVLVSFCLCLTLARRFKCSKIISVERLNEHGYINFTLKLPYSTETNVIAINVHLSATPKAFDIVKLALANDEAETRRRFKNEGVVSYILSFNSALSAPRLLKIEAETATDCILYCDRVRDFRTGVKQYILREETVLDQALEVSYPHCMAYKPLLSPLPKSCGETSMIRTTAGSEVERGSWPWLVPIFFRNSKGLTFICGGNIIGPQTILTAAHCVVTDEDLPYKPEQILVFTGRHNLADFNEKGFVAHFTKEIVVHPRYKRPHTNDIALINLDTVIEFTDLAQPVCLWRYSKGEESIVAREGLIAGWGRRDDGEISPVPHIFEQTIIDTSACKQLNEAYSFEDFNSTMCAVGLESSVPCKGDSGGGLMLAQKDQRYAIRGLVSTTLGERENGCGSSNYVAYSDVAKYYNWIRSEMV